MDQETQEILHCFVDECRDALMVVESSLEELEDDPESEREEILSEVFRRIHSMKGSAGYLGLETVQRVSHRIESVLKGLMDGSLLQTPELLDTLALAIDFIGERLEVVLLTGSDAGARDVEDRVLREISSTTLQGERSASSPPQAAGSPSAAAEAESVPSPEVFHPSSIRMVEFMRLAEEHLKQASMGIHDVLQDPGNEARLSQAYLAVRRLREHSQSLGLEPFRRLASALELSLAGFLQAPMLPERSLLNVCSEGLTALRETLAQMERTGQTTIDDLDSLVARLRLSGGAPETPGRASRLGEVLVEAGYLSPQALELVQSRVKDPDSLPQVLREMRLVDMERIEEARRVERERQKGASAKMPKATPHDRLHETIRVDVAMVDRLQALLGPPQSANGTEATTVSSERLQQARELVRDIRMTDLTSTFRRMRRLVADVSAKCGKEVVFDVSGEHLRIQRRFVEVISDAMVHALRNAVDHGIEFPQQRRKLGKPPAGKIRVNVVKGGSHLVVSVADDGMGLDMDRIHRRALETGLTDRARDQISEEELCGLIFQQGVSTASTVSDISGRGVGLDVVRLKVESVGGKVSMSSRRGIGTRLSLAFPQSDSCANA